MPPSIIEWLSCCIKRTMFWCLSWFVMYAMAMPAHAAALGELVVQSRLGQPLQAEIKLLAVTPAESAALLAKLAAPEMFKRANVPFDPVLDTLKFGIIQRDGDYYVTLSSERPMEKLAVSLLLEINAESSRLMREYTLLMDPADAGVPAPAPQESPAMMADASQSSLFRITGAALPGSQVVQAAPMDGVVPAKVAYTIRPDDFLGRIATRFKADDISVYQMMVAIFRTNRAAFVGNNINRLRVGSILVIPDHDTVRGVDLSEARSLVIQQGKAYRSDVGDAPGDGWYAPLQ